MGHDAVKGKLGFDYEDLGEQTLKNIPEPVRAYRVLSSRCGGPPGEGRQKRHPGDADPSSFGQGLEAGGDVHAVSVDPALFLHHIP